MCSFIFIWQICDESETGVPSDPAVRLRGVQEQAPHVSPHSAQGRSACAIDSEQDRLTPVLSFEGRRVYDACDIPALMALSMIPVGIDLEHQRLLTRGILMGMNAAAEHHRETGHALAYGCCRERVPVNYGAA